MDDHKSVWGSFYYENGVSDVCTSTASLLTELEDVTCYLRATEDDPIPEADETSIRELLVEVISQTDRLIADVMCRI